MNIQMFSHAKKRRLQPAEVFAAAEGMLLSFGYAHLQRVNDDAGEPLGLVFEKNGERVVLYYPGKDNKKSTTIENTARPLASIYNELHNRLKPLTLENALEVFFVCESNMHSKHYVLAIKKNDHISLYDSLSNVRPYALGDFMLIFANKPTLKTHYAGAQKDNNSCGVFSCI